MNKQISLYLCTGWNDKIVVLKKTTLQLYFKTFIEKINSGNLIMKKSWHLFNVVAFSLNHHLDTDLELGACLFHKHRREFSEYSADGGDQAIFGVMGGHVGVLDVWPNEVVQRVQVGEEGDSKRRVQSRSNPSEAKLGSLWTCGPAPNPAATARVCHRPPDCTRGSPHRWGVSSMIA